jgi:hypothetical protein
MAREERDISGTGPGTKGVPGPAGTNKAEVMGNVSF